MKKRIMVITVSVTLVSFFITFNFLQKNKVNRQIREEFKEELLTYQSNIDFANMELTNDMSSFFDMDILDLANNMLYFDDTLGDFTEDLEDSLYDYEDTNDNMII